MSPLMALSSHSSRAHECPLSGVKQTWAGAVQMSAFDPKRTLIGPFQPTSSCRYDALYLLWESNEATRVHIVDRRRGGVAARHTRTAGRTLAAHRSSCREWPRTHWAVSRGARRAWLCRGKKYPNRNAIG